MFKNKKSFINKSLTSWHIFIIIELWKKSQPLSTVYQWPWVSFTEKNLTKFPNCIALTMHSTRLRHCNIPLYTGRHVNPFLVSLNCSVKGIWLWKTRQCNTSGITRSLTLQGSKSAIRFHDHKLRKYLSQKLNSLYLEFYLTQYINDLQIWIIYKFQHNIKFLVQVVPFGNFDLRIFSVYGRGVSLCSSWIMRYNKDMYTRPLILYIHCFLQWCKYEMIPNYNFAWNWNRYE